MSDGSRSPTTQIRVPQSPITKALRENKGVIGFLLAVGVFALLANEPWKSEPSNQPPATPSAVEQAQSQGWETGVNDCEIGRPYSELPSPSPDDADRFVWVVSFNMSYEAGYSTMCRVP